MNLAAKVRLYMNLCAVEAGSANMPALDVRRLRETLGFEIEARCSRLEQTIRKNWSASDIETDAEMDASIARGEPA